MSLREDLVRLAYQKPALRPALLPLLEPSVSKQAALKGWKKGPVPIAMHQMEDFVTYVEGITYGVWGIVKRAGAWPVTHIPSGMAAYQADNDKIAKAFVEALLVTEPALATERNASALTTTYKQVFLQFQRSRPEEWPKMGPGMRIPNTRFEYEGGLPIKVLQDTQLPLPRNWAKVLRDIAENGKVLWGNYPKRTVADMHMKELIKYSQKTITWTPKGEKSYKDGYISGESYVTV